MRRRCSSPIAVSADRLSCRSPLSGARVIPFRSIYYPAGRRGKLLLLNCGADPRRFRFYRGSGHAALQRLGVLPTRLRSQWPAAIRRRARLSLVPSTAGLVIFRQRRGIQKLRLLLGEWRRENSLQRQWRPGRFRGFILSARWWMSQGGSAATTSSGPGQVPTPAEHRSDCEIFQMEHRKHSIRIW